MLDFEALLTTVIRKHIHGILVSYERTLLHGLSSRMFSYTGEVAIMHEGMIRLGCQ